jgi:plasmid stabilization system protein ParE
VSPHVRFEDEAHEEYRLAGRYYEERGEHLGIEFFDAVDATIDQIVELPRAGALVSRMPADVPVRRRAVTRFPYHVIYLEASTSIRILADSRFGAFALACSRGPDFCASFRMKFDAHDASGKLSQDCLACACRRHRRHSRPLSDRARDRDLW